LLQKTVDWMLVGWIHVDFLHHAKVRSNLIAKSTDIAYCPTLRAAKLIAWKRDDLQATFLVLSMQLDKLPVTRAVWDQDEATFTMRATL